MPSKGQSRLLTHQFSGVTMINNFRFTSVLSLQCFSTPDPLVPLQLKLA